MTRYIITYDLSAPCRNYDGLYARIKQCGRGVRISESSIAIMSDLTSKQIVDRLSKALDSNDKLLVGRLDAYAARGLSANTRKWLKANPQTRTPRRG